MLTLFLCSREIIQLTLHEFDLVLIFFSKKHTPKQSDELFPSRLRNNITASFPLLE